MDSSSLNFLIDSFERMVSGATSSFRSDDFDWRPAFAQAKEIQAGFSSGIRYPTKQERDVAWIRFNNLRTNLHAAANKQRDRFRSRSERVRDGILDTLRYAGYTFGDKMFDDFNILRTTAEDMKKKGETVKEAGQTLSSNKHSMLSEHKEECFTRIQRVMQEHDAFWKTYNRMREARRHESIRRRSEIASRINDNLRANTEKLERAVSAYERVEGNIESNIEKLESARSQDFAERVKEWIEQDREKLRSISGSIERLREWIAQDESRLGDLERRNS